MLFSLVSAMALLGVLSAFAYKSGPLRWEVTFMKWYQAHFDASAWESLMKGVSWLGGDIEFGAITVAIAAFFAIRKDRLAAGLALSAIFAFLGNWVVKGLVERPRPTPDIVRVLETEGSYGFPSGHVTSYIALFGVTLFLITVYMDRSWGKRAAQVVLAALILLVGPSRMTLGVHWPSDVGGSYLAGAIYLLIAIPAWLKLKAAISARNSKRDVMNPQRIKP